ncbi:hypothetical protein [Paenibacillus sp. Marseille-Q7038]
MKKRVIVVAVLLLGATGIVYSAYTNSPKNFPAFTSLSSLSSEFEALPDKLYYDSNYIYTSNDIFQQSLKAQSLHAKQAEKLTQMQKEEYYKQYAEIIDVVTNGSIYGLEIAPIEEFMPEDWVDPNEFEKIAIERANTRVIFNNQKSISGPDSTVRTIKSANMNYNGTTITFTASIDSNAQIITNDQRKLLSSAQIYSSSGSWSQTGNDISLMDGGCTPKITIGGKFTFNGIVSHHNFPMSVSAE